MELKLTEKSVRYSVYQHTSVNHAYITNPINLIWGQDHIIHTTSFHIITLFTIFFHVLPFKNADTCILKYATTFFEIHMSFGFKFLR